jgi:hypothetical protein
MSHGIPLRQTQSAIVWPPAVPLYSGDPDNNLSHIQWNVNVSSEPLAPTFDLLVPYNTGDHLIQIVEILSP